MDDLLLNKEFTLRKCKDEDYTFVYTLFKRNMYELFMKNYKSWKPEVFRKEFNKDNITIIEKNRRRVGFYDIVFFKDHAYIKNIQISSIYRGKGLGTQLLDRMEKETRRKKLKIIRLRVFNENPAKELYKKIGFKKYKDDKYSTTVMGKKI